MFIKSSGLHNATSKQEVAIIQRMLVAERWRGVRA